jgi:Zn-finger nucleic acid-binding protein
VNCPIDGNALVMTPFEADVNVDQCPACSGVFVRKGDLAMIEQTQENVYPDAEEPGANEAIARAREAHESGPRACPVCSRMMEAAEYGLASGITVDNCPHGCGTWFDAGELEAIERYVDTRRREQKTEGWLEFVLGLLR